MASSWEVWSRDYDALGKRPFRLVTICATREAAGDVRDRLQSGAHPKLVEIRVVRFGDGRLQFSQSGKEI